jgi:predicted Zn-dependent protease
LPGRSPRSRQAIARVLGAAFETLLANLPGDPDTLNAIGVLGLQLGEPQRALAPLVRAMEQRPRDPGIRCHLAIAYRSLGEPDRAIAEIEDGAFDRSLSCRSALESRQPDARAR